MIVVSMGLAQLLSLELLIISFWLKRVSRLFNAGYPMLCLECWMSRAQSPRGTQPREDDE